MALILNIESSTEVCSVALAGDGKIIELREDLRGQNHAALLTVFIEGILDNNSINFKSLDAVAVSSGPGSYTGLRIGTATAKGICYGAGLPLIAVNSLSHMANHVILNKQFYHLPEDSNILFCPMIDARRMEVYTALYNSEFEMIGEIGADIIDSNSYSLFLNRCKIIFFGNGVEKCKKSIAHDNAFFLDHIHASAGYMAALSEKAFGEEKFENVAYFEPFYLKDFIATIPTKNVFKHF